MTEPRDPQRIDPLAPRAASDAEREEIEERDDAVIGHALRRSLVVIAAAALVVATIVFIRTRPEAAAPEQVIDEGTAAAVARDAELPGLPFTDVTEGAGVRFVHENGARGDKLLPESMGSGVALFDYDGDRDADLLLIDGRPWDGADSDAPSSRLYRNDSSDGTIRFTDASAETGIDQVRAYGTGVAVADVDGDGRREVFIAAVGRNRLLRAGEDGRYADVTAAAGVAGADDAWSTSAAFFDADGDGDLDLFVGNYVVWSRQIDYEVDYRLSGVGRAYGPPVNYQGTFSYLYRNDSSGPGDVRFTDVSAASGIQIRNDATGVPVGKALGVMPVDADGDGHTDLLVANDTVRNFLFRNRGGDDVAFEEVGELWGVAYGRTGEATGAMGIDAGFVLDARDLGFAIGNFSGEMSSLYLAQGDPTLYADDAIGLGIGAPSRAALTFGMLLFDVDLDGRLDLLATNGHLETEINSVDPSQTYEQPAQLFWNAGPAARPPLVPLADSMIGDLAAPIVGRGSAVADLDGDGDLDVALTQTGRRAIVLRNDQRQGHHWLRIVLRGRAPNTEAVGARLVLRTAGGEQRAQVNGARSYQSHSETVVTFGLGDSSTVESLEIVWPGGDSQTVAVAAVDRLMIVEQ